MESDPAKVPLIVMDHYISNTNDTLLTALKNLSEGTKQRKDNLLIWNSSGANLIELDNSKVKIINHSKRLLSSGQYAKTVLKDRPSSAAILLVDSSVHLSADNVRRLMEKWTEYDEEMILCTQGLRLFPHLLYAEPKQFWQDGRFTRFHQHTCPDREVHLLHLDGGCCLFPTKLLHKALTLGLQAPNGQDWQEIGDYCVSVVARKDLEAHIWKVQIDLNKPTTNVRPFSCEALPELEELYHLLSRLNWPESLLKPVASQTPRKPRRKETIWEDGFCGVNMSAEPVELDFAAVSGYGASVVRFGAVNDAKDLSFLINDVVDGSSKTDKIHLKTVVSRLKESIQRADNSGLKVILTLCDLPGRIFLDPNDERLWRSADYRQRIADLWAAVAEELSGVRDVVIAYDVINEPNTPDDTENSFDCPVSRSFMEELHDLYDRAIKAIRAVDSETMVIVESSYWASPRAFPLLQVWQDAKIVYSFHFYAPNLYTCRYENDGRHGYPGRVPMWRDQKRPETWPNWDGQRVRNVIQTVVDWQKANSIPATRIFVGEFGVSREVPGAQRYLADVSEVWKENGWSSCLFSFRDNEWDAMDYELGEDITNQLNRQPTAMIQMIAKHFY